jgi:hypothetical protein
MNLAYVMQRKRSKIKERILKKSKERDKTNPKWKKMVVVCWAGIDTLYVLIGCGAQVDMHYQNSSHYKLKIIYFNV